MTPDFRWFYMGATLCGLTLLAAMIGFVVR